MAAAPSGMDKYVRGKVLGKGSFGQAVLVTNKLNGKNYVVKEIDISRMPKAEREASEQEAKLLMALSHPNIVRCLECFTHQNKLCIVMDWCSEGDLYGITQKRRGMPLSEETILDWMVQICLGLKHVHDRKILHRDIKTQNIFMSAGGILKLGDFGVSKVLASTSHLAATAVGTPYYLSPEICQNKRYNQKSDIWSLGCVLYELACGRHAFEAPSMRALIQKIIKGQYPPPPATRSKELRDLIDRMLTLNWEKRPSINEILATPVIKARIAKFLSATLQAHEFSHTIIHGRPERGQLVVQPPAAAGQPPAPPAQPRPAPAAAAAAAPVAPARAGGSPAHAARPGSGAAAGAAAAPQGGRRGASPTPAAPAAAAAAAAQPAVVRRGEEDVRRQRELAAVAAQREVERMKLEDQRKKLEAERAKLEGERAKAEAARVDAERRAKAAEEAMKRQAGEEAKRRAEEARRRAKLEEEQARKDAERDARERKREEERQAMLAQKREYMRNKAAVEQQLHNGQVQVFDAPANNNKPRKQWVNPSVPDAADGGEVGGGRGGGGGDVALTPEQRRAVWEEQRAAAERNRRAAAEADRQAGAGLAGFLGVPQEDDEPERPCGDAVGGRGRPAGPSAQDRRELWEEQRAVAERNRRQAEGDRPPSQPPPQQQRRPDSRVGGAAPASVQDAYERRRKKLEEEAARREQEIREYQRQHWQEMRAAAARNRAAILSEVGPAAAPPSAAEARAASPEPPPQQQQQQQARRAPSGGEGDVGAMAGREDSAAAAADDLDFAAMIKDMQDVLVSEEGAAPGGEAGRAAAPTAQEEEEEQQEEEDQALIDGGDEQHMAALAGRFVLNGEEIKLPVRQDDSLAAKVEALRCFLEDKLGTKPFLKVYQRLESLSLDDDETQVSQEFLAVLGPERLPYLQLIHQLIVCEENLNFGA